MNRETPFSGFNIILWCIISVVLIRIVLVFTFGLMPQDAYYYYYSEHLDWSFFDHPAMVAVMLKIFTSIFGVFEVSIKLANFITTLGTTYVFYKLAGKFLEGFQHHNALYLWLSTMLVSILSLVTTPDVPLLLFWALTLWWCYKAIEEDRLHYWILTGFFAGLAFNSKYTAVLLMGGLFGLLLFSKSLRKYLLGHQFLTVLIVFTLTILPVIYWNYENDWISLKFQSSDRISEVSFFQLKPKFFLGTIGTQIFLLLPFLFGIMFSVVSGIKSKIWQNLKNLSVEKQFLLWFSLPMLIGFFTLSLFYWVKLNWMMPAYITAIILTAPYFTRKWMKHQSLLSLVFHIAFYIQVQYYPFPITSDDTWWGWEELSHEVEAHKTQYPQSFIFSDDGYKTSAQLNFHLPEEKIYSGNILGKNGLQFSMVDQDLSHLEGKNALFIDSQKRFDSLDKSETIPPELETYFDKILQLEPIILYNEQGEPIRKFFIYHLTNYQPPENM